MNMYDDNEIADALDCAADYLRTFGLAKGTLGGKGGPACALGAMEQSCPMFGDLSGYPMHYAPLADAVRKTIGSMDIVGWSDHPERTAEEVADTFQETAARLRGF